MASRWRNSDNINHSFSSFLKEMDVAAGNPSAAMGPAERARQLGLQSNGKGGYIDPGSGQVVAQTVNGELVFYSQNRATGGAVSDSAGGAALVTDAPSWADPVTGMVTTPPGRPEGPEEMASVPDPVPATAPHGYNSFMTQRKKDMYAQSEMEKQQQGVPGDMDMGGEQPMAAEPQQPVQDPGMMGGGGMGLGMAEDTMARMKAAADARKGDYSPGGLAKATSVLGGVPVTPQMRSQNYRDTFTQNKALDKRKEGIVKPQPETPQDKVQAVQAAPDEKKQQLVSALESLLATPDRKKGAGANDLSDDDIGNFINYINNGPQNEKIDVSDDDMNFAMEFIKEKTGKTWGKVQDRLKGKGSPPPELANVKRGQAVLRSYLSNLGTSSIDGSPLAFSESELDHIMSLSNGGEDNGDNWAWLPRRFNQFKGALEDNDLLEKLEELRKKDPKDKELESQEKALRNKIRGDWGERFKTGGWEELNKADILDQKGSRGMQQLKALAKAAGINTYKSSGRTRDSGRAGGGRALNVGDLQQALIKQLNIPDEVDVTNIDKSFFELMDQLEERRSDLESEKIAQRKKKRAEKVKSIKEEILQHRSGKITFSELVERVQLALDK